uniref:VWFD domain-containing protein n=1 Tax=Callorhinchus milii TaxID=7868 RepID=A0A4W3HDJ2_CALMI
MPRTTTRLLLMLCSECFCCLYSVCSMGQWNCTNLSCPGTCSVEGGSFFTTFDSRSYRLYGACTYVLVKSSMLPEHGHIEGVFARCGVKPTEICVKAIVYTNNKVKITFLKGGLVYVDNKFRGLPYVTGDIRIHRKSAKYVQMSTQFGLKMEILVHPILQLYITVQITFFGTADGEFFLLLYVTVHSRISKDIVQRGFIIMMLW